LKYIIITGASRGLGKALCEELANKENTLILIGRDLRALKQIRKLVDAKGCRANIYCFDLLNYNCIHELMDQIVASIINCSLIILINNASVINPINKFDLLTEKDIETNLSINCLAPIFFMNLFLSKTNSLNVERRIINISSGVIYKSIYGWSLYSAAKSAVHSVIDTISKENDNKFLKVVSFDPGIMDTNMQEIIRQSSKSQFKDVDIFKNFYEKNQLKNPKEVASIINKAYVNRWMVKNTYENIGSYKDL
jgi:benzil reductase ((S)-benzoin forming)